MLTKILDEFRVKEKSIGKELSTTFAETQQALSTLGTCPICKDGTLQIRKGKFGRFAACNKYPKCETTFKLPGNGMIKSTEKACETCQYPLILIFKKAKKPQQVCLNSNCPTKKQVFENEGKSCPKCGNGKLIIRKSVYGWFLAFDKFPKCFHIEGRAKKKPEETPTDKPTKKPKKTKSA